MKIKKILSFVTALTISFGAMQIVNNYSPDIINAAESDDFEFADVNVNGDGMRFKVYSDHAELFVCSLSDKDELILPETVEGVPLTVLGDSCLGSKNIKKAVIPDNIKTISASVFEGCENLETVTIPEGIETIEAETFERCTSLKNVNLPDSLKEIKSRAFAHCTSLESIEVPDGVVSIGEYAFDYCENLKNISFPDSVEKIGNDAFHYCHSLESAVLPKSLKSVSDESFFYCYNLRSVSIPEGVTHIGKYAFYQCKRLEELSLPNSIEEIGENALYHCDNLVYLTIPEKIDSLKLFSENIGSLTVMNPEFDFDNAFSASCSIDVIYGYKGSTAETFASEFNIKFEAIDEEPSSETADKPLNGDANCDGQVDMSDIVLIMQALSNPNRYGVNGTDPKHITADGSKYADTDGDGLTVNDALRIQQYLLGLISSLA